MIELVIMAAIFLGCLLLADLKGKEKIAGWLKTLTSVCMVTYCGFQVIESPNLYAYLIFGGIVFGLLGDVFLIPKSKNSFLLGMAAFLVGHFLYIAAFFQHSYSLVEWFVGFLLINIAMYAVFNWIKAALKGVLKIGVAVYMVTLAAMCSLAMSVRIDGALTLVGLGATLFMISDFFVASHRFKNPHVMNRIIGLPLYYSGQFILATSVTIMQTESFWLPV